MSWKHQSRAVCVLGACCKDFAWFSPTPETLRFRLRPRRPSMLRVKPGTCFDKILQNSQRSDQKFVRICAPLSRCYHQGGMQRRLSARSSGVVESSRSGGGSDSELNHVTRTVPPKSENNPERFVSRVSRLGCLLPHDFACLLVFSESEKDRPTKALIARPLSEFDLANHYWLNPMATSHLSGGQSLIPTTPANRLSLAF
jgi:hypothetical protein